MLGVASALGSARPPGLGFRGFRVLGFSFLTTAASAQNRRRPREARRETLPGIGSLLHKGTIRYDNRVPFNGTMGLDSRAPFKMFYCLM